MNSITGNNTWLLVNLPPSCKPISYKWIFRKKTKINSTIENIKAQVVAQGFRQKHDIDYFDAYALVAKTTTIRL